MMSLPLFSLDGSKKSDVPVADILATVHLNPALVHRCVTVLQKRQRISTAHTKARSDVRGGGRKPWKQKGTGRARAGSIRSPLWVGGGTTFGPLSDRVYTGKVNRKERRLALRMALASAARDGRVTLVDTFDAFDGKTQSLSGFLQSVEGDGSILVVTDASIDAVVRAGNNLEGVSVTHVGEFSLLDLVSSKRLVFSQSAWEALLNRCETASSDVAVASSK